MDAVTYPVPAVRKLLADRFVCYSVNEGKPLPADKDLMRKFRVLWSPAIVILEPRGAEIRRWVGYRRPDEFEAELELALGLTDLLYRRFEDAAIRFAAAAHLQPDSALESEALFWRGIARFKGSKRDYSLLRGDWERIRHSDPTDTWWSRADVWDAKPTGKRVR